MTFFSIAGLRFGLQSDALGVDYGLNYAPFRCECDSEAGSELLFKFMYVGLSTAERDVDGVWLAGHANTNGRYDIYELSDGYLVVCHAADGALFRMTTDRSWSQISVDDNIDERDDFGVVNDFIMIAFTYAAAAHSTVMIHASAVCVSDFAVAFVGVSGVGKSTHSQLWLDNIDGSELVNDDQPALRIIDGKPYICGTPWSGKTCCYKNISSELVALFLMKQSTQNRITEMSSIELFRELICSCSMIRSDSTILKSITDVVAKVSEIVMGAWFENRPEREAAIISHGFVNKRLRCL